MKLHEWLGQMYMRAGQKAEEIVTENNVNRGRDDLVKATNKIVVKEKELLTRGRHV
jgi:hypothetical protein